MARGKAASAGEIIPRDFREQLQAAEASERNAQSEFDPGNIGSDISDDLALANTLAQIGEDESNAKVFVYKIDKATKLEAFAFETSPAEFATGGLTEIGKRYGGGEYRIRVYADGRILTHKRIAIMEQKESPQSAPVNIAADLQGLFAQQQNALLEGFKMLAESLKPAPQSPAPTMLEQMETFARMQALMGGNRQQSGPDFGQLLEVLKQGMEMGRGAGEQSMLDVLMRGIETFGPAITEAVKTGAVNQPAPMMHAPAPAIAAPVPAIQTAAPTNEDEMGILRNAMLKQAINFLVNQAKADNDPETYANMVMDQMDENALKDFINRPDWIDFLAQFNPDVKLPQVSAWFDALRAIIIEFLTMPPESGTSAPHATTDNANAAAVATDGNTVREGGNG